MRAIIIASLLSFCTAAHAGPPWTFLMDPDHGRVATIESTDSGYPDTVQVIVRIPKNQKGFDGKEITTADLKVFQDDNLLFGARLDVVDMRDFIRMTFELPERHLKASVVRLQTSPISSVTYLLRISDHLNSDGHLPSKKSDKAEQGGTGQPATRPESKSEGLHKPQPESEGRSR
jgi:hypothetical protein